VFDLEFEALYDVAILGKYRLWTPLLRLAVKRHDSNLTCLFNPLNSRQYRLLSWFSGDVIIKAIKVGKLIHLIIKLFTLYL